jgi:hypothetical protein
VPVAFSKSGRTETGIDVEEPMIIRTLAWLAILGVGSPLQAQDGAAVFRSYVRLVEVYATVFDHHGRYMDGLKTDGCELPDEGVPQPIVTFKSNSANLSRAMVLDTRQRVTRAVRREVSDRGCRGDLQLRHVPASVTGFHDCQECAQDSRAANQGGRRAIPSRRRRGLKEICVSFRRRGVLCSLAERRRRTGLPGARSR